MQIFQFSFIETSWTVTQRVFQLFKFISSGAKLFARVTVYSKYNQIHNYDLSASAQDNNAQDVLN